jgi:hypothetical protein
MDAIDRAGVYASRVLGTDAGFCDDIRHLRDVSFRKTWRRAVFKIADYNIAGFARQRQYGTPTKLLI